MHELYAYLTAEQPRINAALSAETATLHPLVRPVAEHVLEAGGKRLRPLLVLLMARLFGYRNDDAYPLACSVELLHSATLLHDDILDEADLRRGLPSAHVTFGTTPTVLAGDALLALANLIVARYGDAKLTACISEAIIQTATGEIVEIAHMRSTAHSQQTYIDIITGKTAWMLQASCELGALRGGATPEQVQAAAAFGLNLGIAFQIVDDALDFADRADTGKPVGGDLREGKLTPPIIMYRDTLTADARQSFDAKFTEGTFQDAEIQSISADIRALGVDTKTRELAGSYLKDARTALMRLPDVQERSILLQTVAYVQERRK